MKRTHPERIVAKEEQPMEALNAYVVEDNDDLRLLLSRALRLSGLAVEEFASAEAALHAFRSRREPVDLAVVGFDLGCGMTGSALIEQMRAQPEAWSMHAFLWSASLSAVDEAERIGVPLLSKLSSTEALVAEIYRTTYTTYAPREQTH